MQWVSVTMAGSPNTSPMIRFALFLPTPGSDKRASKSLGTFPSYFSHSIFIQALISFALLCPSPQGFTILSMSSTDASASSAGVLYFANSSCTTTLTLASVHCAASLTLTSSFQASSYSRLHSASGYSFLSRSMIESASFCFAVCAAISFSPFPYSNLSS